MYVQRMSSHFVDPFFFRLDAPIFIVRPPKFVVLDFDSHTSTNPTIVRCVVDSFPRSRISWFRYGQKLADGPLFNLEKITTSEQQGFYSYRVETDGFEPIHSDFIIYIKGMPGHYCSKEKSLSLSHSFCRQTFDLHSRVETPSLIVDPSRIRMSSLFVQCDSRTLIIRLLISSETSSSFRKSLGNWTTSPLNRPIDRRSPPYATITVAYRS